MLADALTSLLAIVALLAGKYLGMIWMDPAMGIVGAVLVSRWAWGLLRDSSSTLLDRQAPDTVRDPRLLGAQGDALNRAPGARLGEMTGTTGSWASGLSVIVIGARRPCFSWTVPT